MRNAILPPTSSEIYNFGNDEVQIMPNSGISMDNNSFSLESKGFNCVDNQQRYGDFAIPYQNYQPGNCQFTSSNRNKIDANQSILPQDLDFQFTTMRKGSFDSISTLQQGNVTNIVENKISFNEWEKNKRNKANSFEDKWQNQIKETNFKDNKIPVRRSQKLSDKITALQKLVSPYGKTDTASVLQEASLYIKLLQQQIHNLFQMLTSSCPSQKFDDGLLDLQGRGLCLFPVSVMRKLNQENDLATCDSYTIDPVITRNF